MRDLITADLAAHIEPSVVEDIVSSYEELLAKHKSGELDIALTKAGRFVEHVLRAIEFIRTSKAPTEIKSVASSIKALENDTALDESLRLLIPRALYGMIYNPRSKRNAVHVKEIDPRHIDVAMAVSAASWTLAELLRLYHVSDEASVEAAMFALSRTSLPFIESVDGEIIVGADVDAQTEVLLLLAHAGKDGLSRTDIGKSAKCPPSTITSAIGKLEGKRYVHKSASKRLFITSTGEQHLADKLAGKLKKN